MKKYIKHILIISFVLLSVLVTAGNAFADIPPYSDDYQAIDILVNGKKISEKAFTIKGNIYIKIGTLRKYGDMSKLKINEADKKVTFNTKDMSINLGNTQASEFVQKNAGECCVYFKTFTDEYNTSSYYVPLGPIAQIAKLAWSYTNNKLLISQYSKATNLATIEHLSGSAASIKNESIVNLSTGEKVFIIKESNSFYNVETIDGSRYYVNKDDIKKIDDISKINDFEYIPTAKDSFDGKINLGWVNLAENATRTPLPPEDPTGLDVLSPIWLHLPTNENGYVRHLCDYGYVQLAHSMGYKVWMCANNCFMTTGSTAYTTQIMESEALTDKVIAQYLMYACMYGVDGINLDFEDLTKANREAYTNFNVKLATYCDMLGLVYSVDTSIPTSYNVMYNWEVLGKYCDYVIPMTYVGTTGSSTVPGSIASYNWYAPAINTMATMVPSQKILLGTPFFTRYWYVDSNGRIPDTSNVKAYTGTISLATIKENSKKNSYTYNWDDSTLQYIITYPHSNGNFVKMWTEEERSMAIRLQYVMDANLGGTACWALDQETEDMLPIFQKVYKEGVDPETILSKYR